MENLSSDSNSRNHIPHKRDILMEKLNVFFRSKKNIDCIYPILKGESKISLRLIDWFVTNFAKKENTCLFSSDNIIDSEKFLVYLNYKAQLKAYTKRQFDPFCRRERIRFPINSGEHGNFIVTTVGQLNFFKWAIENKIIDYIDKNIEIIERDMNYNVRKNKEQQSQKTNTQRKKRRELSVSATKTINRHNISITVNFE